MSALPLGQRHVLVTGGGTGIGRAVAEMLLQLGSTVTVCGRREEPLLELVHAFPGRAFALPVDLLDGAARNGLLERARSQMGGLCGLVHCAGVAVHERLGSVSQEALEQQLELNLVAPLRLAEQALQLLPHGGAMVFVASTLAVRPVETSAVYSASKAGMLAVMKVAALSGAARGVRSNAVLPGVVETAMVQGRGPEALAALAKLHPLGRLGVPEDVAATVVHLLGAAWMTGSEVVVDGGLLLQS